MSKLEGVSDGEDLARVLRGDRRGGRPVKL